MNADALDARFSFPREIEKLKTLTRARRRLDGRPHEAYIREHAPGPRGLVESLLHDSEARALYD